MSSSDEGTGRSRKVARLIDKYDVDGFGVELERRWTAEDPSARASLRDLATAFNQWLLQRILDDADVDVLDGEAENLYRLLTDDDVSAAARTRAERRLEREGIDVNDLRSDLVSYQAIRTYLKDDRGAEYSRESGDRLGRIDDQLQRLRNRTARVTESKVGALAYGGALDINEFRITVDIRVICEDCGSQFDIGTLLDRGECDCSSES
jgi:hypothetical protein